MVLYTKKQKNRKNYFLIRLGFGLTNKIFIIIYYNINKYKHENA